MDNEGARLNNGTNEIMEITRIHDTHDTTTKQVLKRERDTLIITRITTLALINSLVSRCPVFYSKGCIN